MRYAIFFFLIFSHFTAISQNIIPRFETFGVNEGLSQNSVYAIYQDKEGFMWFGTADGLNRYDGDEIKVYKTRTDLNKRGNSNFIRGKLCEDKKGNIWFSTETGLYYYNRTEDRVKEGYIFPEIKTGLIYYYLQGIDNDETLWLLNRGIGVASFQVSNKTWKIYEYSFTPDINRLSTEFVTMDRQSNIWISWYKNDGMLLFNTKEKKYEHFFSGKTSSAICFGKGKHYLSDENFIYRFDSLTHKTDSFQIDLFSQYVVQRKFSYKDSYGNLWCSQSDEGLLYFDFTARKVRQFQRKLSGQKTLSSNIIRTVYEDRSGNLWIGTDGGGVCKLDLKPPFFNLFPVSEGDYPAIPDFFIRSLYEDIKGRIWFGTLKGFNIYDQRNGSIQHFENNLNNPQSLQGNQVSCIFQDREGNTWIGHEDGLSIFNEKLKRFTPVKLEFNFQVNKHSTFVYKIIQLNNGQLLVATNTQLVILLRKKDGSFYGTVKFYNPGVIPSAITGITEDARGQIWLSSSSAGLIVASFSGDSLLVKESFFSGIDFRSIHVDETDGEILWLASGKGLIRFDTRSKKHQLYNESNGMANSYIYGILEDGNHNFWMSTNGGLIYFDRKKNSFQNYSVNDGLQSNEFNTGAFYKGASGNFYFGGVKGINWFRSGSFPESKSKPGVGITSILVENIPFSMDSIFQQRHTIRLKHFQNDLFFQVAAFEYTRPKANKIQYKLEGWDNDWITSYIKQIHYHKLLPGKYTLIVRASNYMGEWSEDEKFAIVMNAPFWQKTWFYLACGSLLLGLVVVVTRNLAQKKIKEKIRQLEKQQAVETERNRISKDMHDEIGGGLTRIALITELMHTQHQLDDKTKHDVNEIAGSTRQLVESMSEIIWALNPHNDKLEDLLAYLREQTRHYFEPLNINYKISFPDTVPDITLSNEQRRNFFLVSKEALNNALKHSGASSIQFIADTADGKIKFSVIDNGKGIDGSPKRTGANGLHNMQQRMKDINGGIEWVSQNGSGTRVNYWIEF